MPTNRMRVKRVPVSINPAVWQFLNDQDDGNNLDVHILKNNPQKIKKYWMNYRNNILSNWINTNPCTRPRLWWQLEAPENRLQVGGQGVTEHEQLAVLPRYECGIPVDWLEIDDNDPPMFESEAAFLQRHDLLTTEEVKYLEKNLNLLEPEVINIEV